MYQNLAIDSSLSSARRIDTYPYSGAEPAAPHWYALYTFPQHEKTCLKQLLQRGVEAFLPTYEQERVWKNRQRVKIQLPLFPSYLFVHIGKREQVKVLGAPGALRIVGSREGPQAIPDSTIHLLQSDLLRGHLEPQPELVVGQRVRIRNGAMQGVEGVLVRKKNALWFVVSIDLINQRVKVQIQGHDIESVQP